MVGMRRTQITITINYYYYCYGFTIAKDEFRSLNRWMESKIKSQSELQNIKLNADHGSKQK